MNRKIFKNFLKILKNRFYKSLILNELENYFFIFFNFYKSLKIKDLQNKNFLKKFPLKALPSTEGGEKQGICKQINRLTDKYKNDNIYFSCYVLCCERMGEVCLFTIGFLRKA